MSNRRFKSDFPSKNSRHVTNVHLRERYQSTSERSHSRSRSPNFKRINTEYNHLRSSQKLSFNYANETRFGEKRKTDEISMSKNKRSTLSTSISFYNENNVNKNNNVVSGANYGFNNNFSSCANKELYLNGQYTDHNRNYEEQSSSNLAIYDPNKIIKTEYDFNVQIRQEIDNYNKYVNEGQGNELEGNLTHNVHIPNTFLCPEELQSFNSIGSSNYNNAFALTLTNQNQTFQRTESESHFFEQQNQNRLQESQILLEEQQPLKVKNEKASSYRRNINLLVKRSEEFAKLIEDPLNLFKRFRTKKYTKVKESSNNILIESNCYRSPIKKNIAVRLQYTASSVLLEELETQLFLKRIRTLRSIMQLPIRKKQPIIPIPFISEDVIMNCDTKETLNIPKTDLISNMASLCLKCKLEMDRKVFVDASCQTEPVPVQIFSSNDPRLNQPSSSLVAIKNNNSNNNNYYYYDDEVRRTKHVLKLEEYINRRANQRELPFKMSTRGACSSGYSSNRF